jgi:hypothetical protein
MLGLDQAEMSLRTLMHSYDKPFNFPMSDTYVFAVLQRALSPSEFDCWYKRNHASDSHGGGRPPTHKPAAAASSRPSLCDSHPARMKDARCCALGRHRVLQGPPLDPG